MPSVSQSLVIVDSAQIVAGTIQNSDIADDQITNAKVNSAAAIAYSKLALTGAVVNNDLAGSIADSKLSQITTASKVSGAALTNLASIPAGAGAIPSANLPAPAGFGYLGSSIAGGSVANLSVSAFTARKHLLIQVYITGVSAAFEARLRFNSDTGNNYDFYYNVNAANPVTAGATSMIRLFNLAASSVKGMATYFIVNNAANEKIITGHGYNGNPGNTLNMIASSGLWNNTAAQITTIKLFDDDVITMGAGSYIIVWGRDDG